MAVYSHNETFRNTLMALNRNSLIGAKFGSLTVIEKAHSDTKNSNWLCECSCGNSIIVSRPLLIKHKTSCGCAVTDKINVKHGNSTRKGGCTREYVTWQSMNRRCANIHDPYYGGRGISVCDRWKYGENGKDGFSLFLLDMVRYPDCYNYEGKKILVTRKAVNSRASLDPHFSGDSSINCGLVARFVPTQEGWEMAKAFCEAFK